MAKNKREGQTMVVLYVTDKQKELLDLNKKETGVSMTFLLRKLIDEYFTKRGMMDVLVKHGVPDEDIS